MLSPAEWHTRVPRDYQGNLRFRRFVLTKAASDPSVQRALWYACANDIHFFINVFVWQYNGKKRGSEVGPFVTWDFQDEALRTILECIDGGGDLIVEKSRDMGASWLFLIVVLWTFLFHPWKTLLCISRNEKAVEDENPESLFWKLDFILGYLPGWLKGGYSPKTGRRKLYFGHPNGSSIYGQASTGQAGVGGKCSFMFIDEFSQIKEDHEVLHRTSDTTDCRLFNGTHLGLDTAFFELTDPESVAGSFMRKLQMHWSQHPDKSKGLYRCAEGKVEVLDKQHAFPPEYEFVKDGTPTGGPCPGLRSPWYDDQCKRKGNARAVAMDLDINPSGSVSQFFDALLIKHLIAAHACDPYWEGELEYDSDLGRPIGLVNKPGGALKLWLKLSPDGLPPPGKYAIAADVSQGTGATDSCATIINIETGEKVGEWADCNTSAEEFGSILVSLAWLFKSDRDEGAKLCWEIPGPGQSTGKRVCKELGYRNVYMRKGSDLREKLSHLPGWPATAQTKLMLLNAYHRALRSRQFLNHSKKALEECLKFKYTPSGTVEHALESGGQDPSGARVNHGDKVMADAMAWLLAAETYQGRKKKEEEKVPVLSLQWRRQLRKSQEVEEW